MTNEILYMFTFLVGFSCGVWRKQIYAELKKAIHNFQVNQKTKKAIGKK